VKQDGKEQKLRLAQRNLGLLWGSGVQGTPGKLIIAKRYLTVIVGF
jgi:hypothetical protein